MLSHNPHAHRKLFHFYSALLRHWTTALQLIARPSKSDQAFVSDLAAHVSLLASSILAALPQDSDSAVTSSILTFFELLSASSVPKTVPIVLPTPYVTYTLVLSSSLATLSRISGVFANYKNAFDVHPTPISNYYSSDLLDTFNGYLMDACNLLWRSRAFLTSERNSAGCLCSPPVRDALSRFVGATDGDHTMGAVFGLSQHPVLARLAAAVWRGLEDARIAQQGHDAAHIVRLTGPVSQRSLAALAKHGGVDVQWKQYRVRMLNWLEDHGCRGIKALMFATMTGLREASG